ncbi:hypothetical protein GCM10023405_10290 [Streptomonospora salina]
MRPREWTWRRGAPLRTGGAAAGGRGSSGYWPVSYQVPGDAAHTAEPDRSQGRARAANPPRADAAV